MLGIWIDDRLPRDRMRELACTRSVEVAGAFIAQHETDIARALAAAHQSFADEASLDDVFEILRCGVVAFVEEHLRCTLLARPRPPY